MIGIRRKDRIEIFDIVFVFKKYRDQLEEVGLEQAQFVFAKKGMFHIDYLLEISEDSSVDKVQLRSDVREMLDELGLIVE